MKYRASALPWKILAFVLAALCLAGVFLCAGTVVWCMEENLYDDDVVFQSTYACARLVDQLAEQVSLRFQEDPDYDRWDLFLEGEDFRFILLNETTGKVVASYTEGLDLTVPDNLKDNPYLFTYDYTLTPAEEGELFEGLYVKDYYPAMGRFWDETLQKWRYYDNYQMLCLLPQELTADTENSLWNAQRQFMLVGAYRYEALTGFCVFGVLFGLLVVFLLCQAGHRPGLESIRSNWLDKVPLEIILAAGVGLVALCLQAVDAGFSFLRYYSLDTMEDILYLSGLTAAFIALGLALTGLLCSCATRLKAGRWWRQTILYGMGWLIWKLFRAMGTVPKFTVTAILLVVLEFFLLVFAANSSAGLVMWFFVNAILLAAVIVLAAQFLQLRKASKRMAEGDLNHRVNVNRLIGSFKDHGRDLNDIAQGMNRIVEQRMKSERLKTELITNVSHDIKTPLTSIVNYVDLLQKPHTPEEETQYLEVLDRQAKRLKRLTENLVEASKASTGNIPVELAPVNLSELLNQAAAEYRHRLDECELELVLSQREELRVRADGKLLWRVLDNLLNNVMKYALPGTRVYLTAERRGDCAAIAVKNISREELNIDAGELMERFVRGDSSRHTDGSGLGLNIAQSLTHLQQGDFTLTVDGDLFKAEIRLPIEE